MKFWKILMFSLLVTGLAEAVMAGQGQTTLMATSEAVGGITADLVLETKPGTGKIFIESYPLTKIDTQISTRFAKEVACNYLGRSCDDLDFFYAIRADAVIIGGPSAGTAIAALTVAVLEGIELNESVSVTGTINSGNVVGHVGGISEKIEAAGKAGIKKVLIPKGELLSLQRNVTENVSSYAEEHGVEIVEVFSLDEVMIEFTGQTFEPDRVDIEVDKKYSDVMAGLASRLCTRTQDLSGSVQGYIDVNDSFDDVREIAENLTRQGRESTTDGSFYAAASYCFGANVRYKFLELLSENLSDERVLSYLDAVNNRVDALESGLENSTTVSDAQILAVVLDRFAEARRHTNLSAAFLNATRFDNSVYELAFAVERVESAIAWSEFFGVLGDSAIPEGALRNACARKLAEAQERIEYARILVRSSSDGARGVLGEAQRFFEEKDYAQCLHKSTLAKSQANTILSVSGARDAEIQDIVERKIAAARATISRQQGVFPIVGYSYYEYANSLKDTDKYSALLFSDYALEFSNIDIYFKLDNETTKASVFDRTLPDAGVSLYFAAGFLIGILSAVVILKAARKKKRILVRKTKRVARGKR